MADPTDDTAAQKPDLAMRIALIMGLFLVVMGMLNTLPSIPGLQPLVGSLTGFPDITIRRFSYEYLFPFAFVVMMVIVALKHSQYRHYRDIHASGFRRRFGLFMDIALVVMAVVVAVSYVIEIDAICALDQISGVRAALIEDALFGNREIFQMPRADDGPARTLQRR